MADCLKSNLSVQEPIYCEDASGNIIPDSAMYSWMAVRAAGPNVLKDTTLCGRTVISDPVFPNGIQNLCSMWAGPSLSIAIQQVPGDPTASEIAETQVPPIGNPLFPSQNFYIPNALGNSTYTVTVSEVNNSNPEINSNWNLPVLAPPTAINGLGWAPIYGNSTFGPTSKTIGVYNNSGADLQVCASLNATLANLQGTEIYTDGITPSMTYYFSIGTVDSAGTITPLVNPLKAGINVDTIPETTEDGGYEETLTLNAVVVLPAGQMLVPMWYPYNRRATVGLNDLIWRTCNFIVTAMQDCNTEVQTSTYQNVPAGPT